jgi:hypothetical protein
MSGLGQRVGWARLQFMRSIHDFMEETMTD